MQNGWTTPVYDRWREVSYLTKSAARQCAGTLGARLCGGEQWPIARTAAARGVARGTRAVGPCAVVVVRVAGVERILPPRHPVVASIKGFRSRVPRTHVARPSVKNGVRYGLTMLDSAELVGRRDLSRRKRRDADGLGTAQEPVVVTSLRSPSQSSWSVYTQVIYKLSSLIYCI